MALVEHETALHSDTAKRLRALAHLYELEQASSLMDQTLTKLMSFEAEQTRLQLETLQSDLLAFEKQYGMDSAEFYRRFQAGETDDRLDFVEWASLFQMAGRLQQLLQVIVSEVPM